MSSNGRWSQTRRRAAATLIVCIGFAGRAHAEGVGSEVTSTLQIGIAAAVAPTVVAVSITRDDQPTWVRVAQVAADERSVSFTNLQPGLFSVRVGPAGAPVASATVRVGARELVALRLDRDETGASALRLDVTGRWPIGEGVDFDQRWLEDLPAGRDLWSLIETSAPYAIVDRMDTGGVALGHAGLFGGRGASWISNAIAFGDLRVLAPNAMGLIPIAPDLTAVTAVSVTSGLAPIEADTPGVIVALTPRQPGSERHGSFHASFTEPEMVDDKALPTAPAIARVSTWREAGAQISFPTGARTALLLSATGARSEFYERNLPALWKAESASLLGHLVSKASDRDSLRLLASAQHVKYPYEYRRQFTDRFVSERGNFAQATAAWDRIAGSTLTTVALSFQRGSFKPLIDNPAGGTMDRLTESVVPGPAASTVSTEWTLSGSLTRPLFSLGGSTHTLRAGIDLGRAEENRTTLALPTVAEQVAGIPARVWIPLAGSVGATGTRLAAAAYVADRITFGSSLTMNLGVRADVAHGSGAGATETIDWRTVSPRGSFQWNRGPLSIFGGAGLYSDPLPLAWLIYGAAGETMTEAYRWHDLNSDRRFDANERGVLVLRRGSAPAIASIDPQLRAPRTFERTAGLELRFGQALTFRSAIIYRDLTELLASVNTGVPASSYRLLHVQDAFADWFGPGDDRPLAIYERLPESFGKDKYLLTNPDGEKATYEGLEFTWNFHTRRLVALFGVTAYRTRSWSANLGFGPLENDIGILGERLEQANAQPVVQGSYFFDRSYVGKLSASYRAPGDIRLAFAARYQDGQPFTRVVVAPDLAGGAEMVHAYRTGQTRYTYTLTLDVRVAKDFSIGRARTSVHLDVFNATRHLNEVEEDYLTTPVFRRSTAMQPPLTARLGFRISF